MNRDWRVFIPAIAAALIFAIAGFQVLLAFRRSGHWSLGPKPKVMVNASDPYARLERVLSAEDQPPALEGLRDPFAYARATPVPRPSDPRPVTPAPVFTRPVLTAIVSDPQDPRAVISFENRNYSVKAGELFAEFRVVSISSEEVVLDNGRQRFVLQRPTKGR